LLSLTAPNDCGIDIIERRTSQFLKQAEQEAVTIWWNANDG
jgi:hypothetical protein